MTRTMAAAFAQYQRTRLASASPVEVEAARRAFYTGAVVLLDSLLATLGESPELSAAEGGALIDEVVNAFNRFTTTTTP